MTVRDSVIRNFTDDGIVWGAGNQQQLYVSNTPISDNGQHGIDIFTLGGSGTPNTVLNHVEMINNAGNGLFVSASAANVNVTVSGSVSANNKGDGIVAKSNGGELLNIMVRNSTIDNNSLDGLLVEGTGAIIRVTRSTITGNNFAWNTASGGVVLSYGDNNIDANGGNNAEPPSPLTYH